MGDAALILCVDDNEGGRYAVVRTLQRAGFRTIEASTGLQALEQLEKEPDLVVLDVQLPDINGYEVCSRIKARPATATTPVLQVSADFVDVEHRARGLELGADAYLAHPLEPPELIATVRALLRARRAEERARAAGAQLRSIYDSLNEGICLLDRDGGVVSCNAAMGRILGCSAEEVARHDSLRVLTAGPVERMFASGQRQAASVALFSRVYALTVDPVRDPQLTGAVIVLTDVTEREQAQRERERLLKGEQAARAQAQEALLARQGLEAELREKVAALQSADQRKDEFLAMLAHELRNPLAAITSGMHLLADPAAGPDALERARGMVLRQIGVLIRHVDDLLDVSRITRGKVELRKERLHLQTLVANALATSAPLLEERHHRVAAKLDDEPLFVEGDPTRLEQVISNLVNNAAKYTEPGGDLRVSLSREDEAALLRISDTGIGIDPSMLGQVFELFAQVDQSPARTRGGLGVGLTLVERLVKLHGGTVRARSDGLGLGSTFEVRLPLAAGAPAAAAKHAPATEPGRRRMVLVEDNPDIGETLRDLLTLLGHRVEWVSDGLRGVQLIAATRPEVALVDIGLPGIDGYEVARRVRSDGGSTLLIALTGYGRPEDRTRALESGFHAHLVKPVEPDELMRLIAQLERERQRASEQAPA